MWHRQDALYCRAVTKRPDGALERDVMAVLWNSNEPLQPGEVRRRLPDELAYTSVATVLGRLQTKGLVERTPAGRAFAYRPVLTEADLAAKRINEVLATSSDRSAVLARFVGTLSKREANRIIDLLQRDR